MPVKSEKLTAASRSRGRKHHIVVDVLGNLLHGAVHAANRHDTKAAGSVLARAAEKPPTIQAFSADAGYRGTVCECVTTELGLAVHISNKIQDGFAVLPQALDCGKDLCLAGQFPSLGQRRRSPYRHCRKHASADACQAALKLFQDSLLLCLFHAIKYGSP